MADELLDSSGPPVAAFRALVAGLRGARSLVQIAGALADARDTVGAATLELAMLHRTREHVRLVTAAPPSPAVASASATSTRPTAELPLSDRSPLCEAIRTGTDVVATEPTTNTPTVTEPDESLPVRTVLALPVHDDRGAVRAGLRLTWPGVVNIDESLRSRATLLADVVGFSIERIRSLDDARVAVERMDAVRTLSAGLVGAATHAEMAEAITAFGSTVLATTFVCISLLAADGATLTQVGTFDASLGGRYDAIGLDAALPMADAARTARAVLIHDAAELASAYPELAADATALRLVSLASIPLVSGGVVIGALTYGWPFDSRLEQPWIVPLFNVAELCAQAFARSRIATLSRARSRLAAVIEATPDFVGNSRPDGQVADLNAAARQMFGIPPDADVGQYRIEDFHPPRVLDMIEQVALPTAARDGVWVGESVLATPHGDVPVSQVVIAHLGPDGTPELFSTVCRDLSDRHAADEARRRSETHLRDVLDRLFAFVAVMSADGTLLEANRPLLLAAGLDPDEVVGRPFAETPWWSWNPAVQDQLRAAIARAAIGTPSRYDAVIRLADGTFATIDFQIAPMADDGDVSLLIASGTDITARVQVERERELRRQLSARLAACADAEDIADTVVAALPALLGAAACAITGHAADGRTPLHAATGFADDALASLLASTDDGPVHRALAERRRIVQPLGRTGRAASDRLSLVAAQPIRSGAADAVVVCGFREVVELSTAQTAILDDIAVQVGQSLDRAALLEQERTARRWAERYAAAAAQLAVAASSNDVGTILAAQCRSSLGTSAASIAVTDGGRRLRWVHVEGAVTDPDPDSAPGDSTVAPAWSAGELRFDGSELRVPLVAGGRQIGVLIASWAQPTTLDDDARTFVRVLCAQAAVALERARLLRAEHANVRRAERIQSVMGALAAAGGRDEVAKVVLGDGLSAIGGIAGAIGTFDVARDGVLEVCESGDPQVWQSFSFREPSLLSDVARSGRPIDVASRAQAVARYGNAGADALGAGEHSWSAVPLSSAGRLIGALRVTYPRPGPVTEQQRISLDLFAAAVADALARASRHESDHRVAVTVQRSLLSYDIPDMPGITVTARYLPATSDLEVGGDFYDVVRLPDGGVLLVIGDIVGHGLDAAVAMGNLRSAAHALAYTHEPAELLTALDNFAITRENGRYATMACVLVDPVRGEVRYSLGGHPPPLLRSHDGVTRLDQAVGIPLGVAATTRPQAHKTVRGPTHVLLYTDGLIEHRDETIDAGIARLGDAFARIGDEPSHTGDEHADELIVAGLGGHQPRDDIALLLASFDAP